MGSVKISMGKSRLKPRRKSDEMRSIALALGAGHEVAVLEIAKKLKSSPKAAKLIAKSAKRTRSTLAAAYPGQTRVKTIKNGDWDRAGYKGIAGLNRILGLKSS